MTSIDALHTFFETTTEVCALLPSYSVVWKEIAGDLVNSNIFCSKLKELQYKAAAAGEYTVVTHDETFKTLFALIGQKKMSQSPGELHALHTFRGFTGCTLGISPQRSTSSLWFETAVRDIFDNFLASKVQFIFSDTPTRIISAARACFSSLIAVGEDSIHLPIRLEHCWGGKTSPLTRRVRQLHGKFRVASFRKYRFWQPEDVLSEPSWPVDAHGDSRSLPEWLSFCKLPFENDTGNLVYMQELAKISVDFSSDLNRRNNNGDRVIDIIRNGAKRSHFEALQNSSRLLFGLGDKGLRLGVGTTRNEQLHRELKSWMANIYQIHIDRLIIGLRIFAFAKLLTHSSAAYYPTLHQKTQQRLLSVMAGKLRSIKFFPSSSSAICSSNNDIYIPSLTRDQLHSAPTSSNSYLVQSRRKKRSLSKLNWKKTKKVIIHKKGSGTDVFKRRRMISKSK